MRSAAAALPALARRRLTIAFAALALTGLGAGAAYAKTWRIESGPEAQASLQTAFAEARPGDTIRLDRGRFELSRGLTLNVDDVTIRGEGEDRSILSFTAQAEGAAGLTVTSNAVQLLDFAVENARGEAISARDCRNLTVRSVRAAWSRGPHPDNGGLGLSVVNCENVLIDGAAARGAAHAGIYVGQSRAIIVRNSVAEMNVAGIEIENSYNADVFSNVVTGNTVGVLVADIPGLAQSGGHAVRLFENQILANNTANFARASDMIAAAPPGSGVVIVAGRDVHVFGNDIGDHRTANVLISAYRGPVSDARYVPLPRDIMIRDNDFGPAGHSPSGELAQLMAAGVRMPDVLWDGADTYFAGGMARTLPVRIVMRDNEAQTGGVGSFLSLGVAVAGAPLSEAAPDPRYPPLVDLPEPARVRFSN